MILKTESFLMTNNITMAKKAFSVAVAATTILWSVGLSAFLPTAASAASFGDLIKGTTLSTVYYYGSDGQRYAFPNEKTFFSWYNDFSSVKTITDSELAAITLAGNIAYRAGSRWVKITSDAKVYVVSTKGKIRWVENEATAKGLGGDNWNTHIDDVPDVFFVDYTVGDSLTSATAGYDGMLWTDGTSKYLVSGAKYSKVTDAGFSANSYKSSFVLSGTGFTKSGLTAGDDVTAAKSSLTDAAQKVTTDTYAATQNVSVALSSASPAASTLLVSQGVAHIATLTFTNPTSTAVTVKTLKLNRTGVSSDTTIPSVYLFDKWLRLSDSAAVSSGVVSWNDASGLFSIPAGGSKEIFVRADIGASTSGQTVGVKLSAASDVAFLGSYAATGTFPIASAFHTIASAPSTFTSISFGAATPAAASVDAQTDFTVWQSTVTVNNNEAYVHALRFRNIGSIVATEINNWRIYVDGVLKGTTVASQDAGGYVVFDFSSAPFRVKTGNHTFKVLADVLGGTNRTVTVGLRNTGDAIFVDEDYNQADIVLASSAAFSAVDAGAQAINTGSLTVTKKSDSPSDKVTIGASGVVLGKWELRASGESMKVESMRFGFVPSKVGGVVADDMTSMRNGAVYADGVQIGSTATLNATDNTTLAYTEYSFGSSLVVVPGTPVTLELRADIFDNDGTDNTADGDTFTARVVAGPSAGNALRKATGSYVQVPTSAVTANQLEIDQGTFTGASNTSYASQTIVAPKTAYKIGSYTITSAVSESINLTGFTVDLDGSSGEEASEMKNLYIEYGKTGAMTTSSVKATPSLADAGNTWSVNYTVASGATIYVNVYVDVDSTIDATDTIITTLDFTGTTVDSGQSADNGGAITGQTITIGAGTFTSALDGSTPVAFATGGKQAVTAAKFRFTSQSEGYTIKEMQVKLASATVASDVERVDLYDGTSLLGSAVFAVSSNTAALVTGLNIPVAVNSYKVITAKLVLNDIGTGAGTSQQNAYLTLDHVKGYDSQGALYTTAAGYTTDRTANEIRVFKSIPTVTAVDLTNSTVVNGQAIDIYKFTVTAGSNGSIALKQLALPVTFSDGLGSGDTDGSNTIEMESFKLYKNGSDITSTVLLANTVGVTVESTTGILEDTDTQLNVIWDTDEDVISAGETATYTLRATPQGFNTDGDTGETDTFSLYLAGDTAANFDASDICLADTGAGDIWQLDNQVSSACTSASTNATAYNFIWSDMSGSSHSGSTEAGAGDWANGYLILNLDLQSEAWSK